MHSILLCNDENKLCFCEKKTESRAGHVESVQIQWNVDNNIQKLGWFEQGLTDTLVTTILFLGKFCL